MKTTVQFIDAVKARHGLPSDYAFAKLIGVKQNTVTAYRTRHTTFNVHICAQNQGAAAAALLQRSTRPARISRNIDIDQVRVNPALRYIRAFARKRKAAHAAADQARMIQPFDLFGEIAVTHGDIALWLRALGVDPASPRAAWYVRAYDVAGKVAAAKARGDWPPKPENA